jgi:hypothetical protein
MSNDLDLDLNLGNSDETWEKSTVLRTLSNRIVAEFMGRWPKDIPLTDMGAALARDPEMVTLALIQRELGMLRYFALITAAVRDNSYSKQTEKQIRDHCDIPDEFGRNDIAVTEDGVKTLAARGDLNTAERAVVSEIMRQMALVSPLDLTQGGVVDGGHRQWRVHDFVKRSRKIH